MRVGRLAARPVAAGAGVPDGADVRVDGLPDGFRYHDLRHYFASLLIAAGRT